jgi:hypothetical protein
MDQESLKIGESLGLGGLGIFAAVLAVKLATKMLEFARAQQARRNGGAALPGGIPLADLRMICPLTSGRYSLDDVREVMVEVRIGVDQQNEILKDMAKDTRAGTQATQAMVQTLALEVASRKG